MSFRLLLMLTSLTITFLSATAQSRIHGKIVDSTGKPIIYANVLLLHANDSTLVKGILTNDKGAYSFENIPAGKYFISTTHAALQVVFSRQIDIPAKIESIGIDDIILHEKAVTLADVTVVAKKPLYEQKIDRLVINVASSITSAGSTALVILERSPGVVVNRFTNSLAINGKAGVIVMINGKRNYMDISALVQMLAAMPSANIERIEIITTPPAKYDADGNAGIINIVMKTNRDYGTNGSYTLKLGYGKWEDNSASLNINHRKKKINIFGDYSYYGDHTYQLWSNYHAVYNANRFLEDESESHRNSKTQYHGGQLGVDYELNKKTVLGVLFTGSYRHWRMRADNNATVYTNKNPDTTVDIVNNELHTTRSYGINLNMQHTFRPDEKISVNFDYLDYYDKNPNDYNNEYFVGNTHSYSEKVRSDKITPLKFWIGAIDYEKKLSKKVSIEAGLKGTTSKLSNDVEVATLIQNSWKADPLFSNFHKLNESVGAAYSSFNITFNAKTSVKTGLRYEYARSNLGSATEHLVNRHYSNLFPTFYVQHKINDSNSVNFSYSHRTSRPSFMELAPWVIFYDPKTFQTGNPYLLPSFSDDITASYTYKDKIISISYNFVRHPIILQPELDEKANRLISTVTNDLNYQGIYTTLTLPFRVSNWWNMQNNLSFGWYQNTSFYKEKIKQSYGNLYATSTQTFLVSTTVSLELSGWLNSGSGWGLYKSSAYGSLGIGSQKKFEKIKSTLSFSIWNLLNTLKSRSNVNLPEQNLFLKSASTFAYTAFNITYNHRFGKDTVKEKRERTTGAEDEKNRAY